MLLCTVGTNNRSYHGTTIQLVQPDPSIPLVNTRLFPLPTALNGDHQTQSKRKFSHSPASSPHKHGKVGPKRPRTVTVRDLTNSIAVTSETLPLSTATIRSELSLQGFQEQSEEKEEREDFESKVFLYMLARHKLPARLVLKDFKTLYSDSKCKDCTSSNIYYLELLDEHPDSADTMRHVSDLLLQNCSSEYQSGYVILVGDGKTYEHLMKIKHLYGNELKKLLIFPGDWHTLANFQPVLMKIYYSAGLKELATTAGYRGETLTSLSKCSNFKRTHNFLIQVWQAMYRKIIALFA